MSSATVAARLAPTEASIWPLARIEAVRYARHPLFIAGFALGVVTSAGERGPMEFDFHVIPSFFIGVFGILIAARLTASTRAIESIVEAAPATQTRRTAALCLACAVPTAAGVVLVLVHRAFVIAEPIADWKYGTYTGADRYMITMLVPVVACAGGPLLGVAVGRWLRFPAAGLLTVTSVLLWARASGYVEHNGIDPSSLFARAMHMGSPYTAFALGNNDLNVGLTSVTSCTGSPVWFTVWTVALCGLAVTAALWRGAVGAARSRAARGFAGCVVLALVALCLAVGTGNQRQYDTTVDGTVPTASNAVE